MMKNKGFVFVLHTFGAGKMCASKGTVGKQDQAHKFDRLTKWVTPL